MISHVACQRALRTKLLTMSGLPAATQRAWENIDFSPTTGTTWVQEEYLPGPMFRVTTGTYGELEARPTYVVTFHGSQNTGMDTLGALADTALTLFAPGTSMAVGSDTLRVRGDTAPYRGQLLVLDGWASVSVTVPLYIRTANSI